MAGVTINGALPEETDPDATHYKDLNGGTTHWVLGAERITIKTSRAILAGCQAEFPELLLIARIHGENFRVQGLREVTPKSLDDHFVSLVFGVKDAASVAFTADHGVVSSGRQMAVSVAYNHWKHPEPLYSISYGGPPSVTDQLGRSISIAGTKDAPEKDLIAASAMTFRASFPAGDAIRRAQFERIGKVVDRHLPVTRLARVDLASGAVLGNLDRPLDQELTRWCEADPDRWIAVHRERPGRPWIGIRPA
ncbi:hypothetical protein [Mesobacterium pallidum]|uniref:hypothetical protein n=1 Tax=Mesobacterium pallidum TaxID=2872037 RepID=UPI001EE1B69E|nr:hypothetical protein [Mesobacterium pallidum]